MLSISTSEQIAALASAQPTLDRIMQGYGLIGYRFLPPHKGYRNRSYPARLSDDSRVNLILYKREPGMLTRIKRTNQLANYAYSQGLPARHTCDPRIVRVRYPAGEIYGALYAYEPGETLAWEAYTRKHLTLLGKTMSDLHAALAGYGRDKLPEVCDEYLVIVRRMQAYFAEATVVRAMRAKLGFVVSVAVHARYETLLRACRRLPGQQALHMDFVRSNLLFVDDPISPLGVRISGILDFEKAAYGHPAFDIARTLAFLLVDCKYKQPDKVQKYFLNSGYRKRGTKPYSSVSFVTPAGRVKLLDSLVELFLLYDFYKFLRHNPYESLADNEHYLRTCNQLLEAGLLQRRDQRSELPEKLLK